VQTMAGRTLPTAVKAFLDLLVEAIHDPTRLDR